MLLPDRLSDIIDADDYEYPRTASCFADKTYDLSGSSRFIYGVEAVKQAVYKALKTQRFRHEVYSTDYGLEFGDLCGCDPEFVCIELERRIKDALSTDSRITDVSGFRFETLKSSSGGGSVVLATFTVSADSDSFVFQHEIDLGQ
ncbi:MAG: DUF2634 domain-containing protein [Oscillospiraceae bacterium]|nr:DUF2634 domain-containing protein [Oscillospiraceae bacterium]